MLKMRKRQRKFKMYDATFLIKKLKKFLTKKLLQVYLFLTKTMNYSKIMRFILRDHFRSYIVISHFIFF